MARNNSVAYWTKRDGTRIRMSDMADEHLANALALMYRVALRHQPLPPPDDRYIGDASKAYAEWLHEAGEVDKAAARSKFPIIRKLEAEIKRRKND